MVDVKRANVLIMDKKYKEALDMYYDGACEGDGECAFNYAYFHLMGEGCEKDEKLAKTFFTFAENIIPEANYNLAVMYLHGTGVKQDYKKAYDYMYEAARRDVIEAQLYLGIAHTMGTMFEPEVIAISRVPYHTPITREEYFMLEGEVPDMEEDEEKRIAAVRLDPRSAFEWFHAAAQHEPDYVESLATKSKYLYARCFVDGLGTDFNRDRANELMLIAAADGSEEAVTYLSTQAPYMLEDLKNINKVEDYRKIYRLSGALKEE